MNPVTFNRADVMLGVMVTSTSQTPLTWPGPFDEMRFIPAVLILRLK